jgi:hypothetical protein
MSDQSTRTFVKTTLLSIAGLFASFTFFRKIVAEPDKKRDTVKMLAEDGSLIEIDAEVFAAMQKKKATDKDVQDWVKK